MAAYKSCHTDEQVKNLEERTVGNNGYAIGQKFTLTGEADWKENTINGVKQVYWVLLTNEGAELSLQSLMGISSLKNYVLEGTVEVDYLDGKNVKTRTVAAEVMDGVTVDDLWMPKSRHFLTEVQNILEGVENLKNRTVTFLGTAVRPIVAKKAGEQNGEKYAAGARRAIETRLWSVE